MRGRPGAALCRVPRRPTAHAVPPGARVLYLPTNAADMRQKRDRYLGEARFGLHVGYGVDLTPRRSYLVLDEADRLFDRSFAPDLHVPT